MQILIAILVLNLLAVVDIWFSRLSAGAKVLWTLTVVFLLGVGLVAWLITRASAHRDLEELPA
jgi:hypothetical protein